MRRDAALPSLTTATIRRIALAVSCIALGGCASYTPLPLEPAATMQSFQARSLDDPQLQHYVLAHPGPQHGSEPLTPWDLRSLTLAAYYFSPALDLARARSLTAAAAIQTASQRPNPTLLLPLGVTTNPKPGDSAYTFGLGLDIPIETAGKRGYRIDEARQLSVAATLRVGAVAWQVRSQLRAQLLELHVAQRRGRLLEQQVKAQQQIVELLRQRLAAGALSAPQAQSGRMALERESLALAKADQDRQGALDGAAGVIGLPAAALKRARIDLDAFDTAPPALPDNAAREAALLNRADVLSALADYQASQAALQLEIANQYPDVHLGPGYTFDAGAHKFALSLSGITLPLFNRNQGPIAQAVARRKEAAARFDAVQAAAIGQADQAASRYRSVVTTLHLSASLQAEAQQQLAGVRQTFAVGESDRLSLLVAELDARSAALAHEDTLAQVQRRIGELEDALQRPLDPSATPVR